MYPALSTAVRTMGMVKVFLTLLFAALAVHGLNNGVGKLPVMGYDTYNAFACSYDEEIALAQAKAMNETGLVALGYNTFILDDCYMQLERNATGYLQENLTQFPSGMVNWTRTINSYGISGSAYSSNGYLTCAGYPGGYGHETQDLEVWRGWGWKHMVKYDNCYIPVSPRFEFKTFMEYYTNLQSTTT
jgi:alpha-galactosidase